MNSTHFKYWKDGCGAAIAMAIFVANAAAAAPVRSDLPLWPGGGDNIWPQSLNEKGAIGMRSIAGIGDWHLHDPDCKPGQPQDGCDSWLRIGVFSLLDGGFTIREATTRAGLETALGTPGFLIALPSIDGADGSKFLALQIGFRGGSRYMLLRGRGDPPYRRFDVLDADCQNASRSSQGYALRVHPNSRFFPTDYCLVRSQKGIEHLARQAARYEPANIMKYVGPPLEAAKPK